MPFDNHVQDHNNPSTKTPLLHLPPPPSSSLVPIRLAHPLLFLLIPLTTLNQNTHRAASHTRSRARESSLFSCRASRAWFARVFVYRGARNCICASSSRPDGGDCFCVVWGVWVARSAGFMSCRCRCFGPGFGLAVYGGRGDVGLV